ncbi:MAG: isoprenylcysteine carboxylmethyltransferase family protein [Vicinamibacterales bacterium]
MTSRVLVSAMLFFLPMAGEALRSRWNERALRQRGAVEPPGDVYRAMALTYPGAFLVMSFEGAWRADTVDAVFLAGLGLWTASKALKYWAIATLGDRWSFRILVEPGRPLIATGPYRWMHHPNYVGVVGELLAGCLLFPAFIGGPFVTLGFLVLLWRRLRIEERALSGAH